MTKQMTIVVIGSLRVKALKKKNASHFAVVLPRSLAALDNQENSCQFLRAISLEIECTKILKKEVSSNEV